jgi:DNA-binding transcriptional LysR family regulator
MNLAHLSYFATLAETKSYRDASRIAAVSQSTLSTAISGLEKELGATLFVRKRGTVDLTPEGQVFLEYVSSSLRFLDNGIEMVREHSGNHIREITIGTVSTAQSQNWSSLIYEFRKELYGDVQIKVVQSNTPDLLEQLKQGKVDVVFSGTMGADPEIAFHPIWSQEVALVVNHRHPLAGRERISLAELGEHYLISYNLEGPLGEELSRLVAGYDLHIDNLYPDEITLGSIVTANPDIMAIACKSWLLDAFHDDVVTIPIEEAPADFHQLYFCHRKDAEMPQVVECFIDLVKRHYPIA